MDNKNSVFLDMNLTSSIDNVPTTVLVAVTVQGIIASIGWLANLFVIVETLRRKHKKDTHFLNYVLHLAISNLIFLTTVPFKLIEMIKFAWYQGQALCKIVNLVKYVNFTVVALLLMVMSIDRYFAAVQTTSTFRTKRVSNWISALVWVISFAGSLPLAILYSADENMKCTPKFPGHRPKVDLPQSWGNFNLTLDLGLFENASSLKDYECSFPSEAVTLSLWTLCNFFYSYLIPFLIIVACYGTIIYRMLRPPGKHIGSSGNARKFRRKVTLMSLIFVITYTICYTPYYVWIACKLVGVQVNALSTCSHVQRFNTTMAYVNSAVQPLVYIVTSRRTSQTQTRPFCTTNGQLSKLRPETSL